MRLSGRSRYESDFGNDRDSEALLRSADRIPFYEEKYGYSAPTRRGRNWKENASITGLMVIGTALMIADISIHHMVMASLAFGTGIVALMKVNYLRGRQEKSDRFFRNVSTTVGRFLLVLIKRIWYKSILFS